MSAPTSRWARAAARPGARAALALATLLAAVGCRGNGEPPETEAFPGAPIVLISIDTLRSDRLPAYGYPAVETPAIDALRRDAILFERAYSHVPLTLPSHASILTGLLPPAHGVRDNIGYRLETAGKPWLPRELRELGYATGAAVSAYVLNGKLGLAESFDFYEDGFAAAGPATQPMGGAGVGAVQRPGLETLERARGWLRSVAGQPFFFFFHVYEPHTPYEPPPPFAAAYADRPYDGEIAAADRAVGELAAELERLGVWDDAVVVLLSDHGEGLGDHGEEEHGVLLYREAIQVPLLLKLPGGRRAGTTVAAPAQLADLFPTLVALAGGTPPADLPGRSLLAAGDPEPRAIYAETFYPRLHFGWSELASLVEDRLHYVEGPAPELFDLIADPREAENLLESERRAYARLRDRLAAIDRTLAPPAEVTDPEERAALAALGYVGATAGGVPQGPLPNPREKLPALATLKAGFRHYAREEWGEAAAAFRRAVADNPRLLDGWEFLGTSLQKSGRCAEAVPAFREALKLSDRSPHLAVSAALCLLGLERPQEALEILRAELVRNPDYLHARLLESRALLVLGRPDEALAAAERAVERAPGDADAVYQRGVVAMARRDLAAAERDLRQAIALAPAHTAAMSDLAVLLDAQGRRAEARRLLERVIAINPGDELARRNLEQMQSDG